MDHEPLFDVDTCRVCGCTDDEACPGGCYWIEEDLCSQCHERLWAVWCFRSGEAFLTKRAEVPEGGMVIVEHEDEVRLRAAFTVCSTHGWEKGKFFVPMLPVAESDDEALKWAKDYREMIARSLKLSPDETAAEQMK